MKVFRIVLCVLLVALLCLSPLFWNRARRDFFAEVYQREPSSFAGTVTLYHIVTERTYAGSLTNWLTACGEQYAKKHKGFHLIVEGMTLPYYLERVAYGRLPDAYSFFSGVLQADALQPVGMQSNQLREGLFDTEYAVPYCFSGYALIRSELQDAPMPEPNAIATLMNEMTEADGVVTDLRSVGDRLRDESTGGAYAVSPVGNYTDAVCWLGIAKDTPQDKADALRGYFAYLQEDAQQLSVTRLGAFSVRDGLEADFTQGWYKELNKAYETVLTVDPFLFAEQSDALKEDASAAVMGNTEANTRFWERMKQILRK